MVHYVYLAASGSLLDRLGSSHDSWAIKIGTTWSTDDRVQWLNGKNMKNGGEVRACDGHADWAIVFQKPVDSCSEAEEVEEIFKSSFEAAPIDRVGAGESDIVLVSKTPLSSREVANLDHRIQDLYRKAFARLHQVTGDEPESFISEEQEEFNRALKDYFHDCEHDRIEEMGRAESLQDDNYYYSRD